jgi:hypothetical protein
MTDDARARLLALVEQLTRYRCLDRYAGRTSMVERPGGEWVKYSDLAALLPPVGQPKEEET